MTFVTTLLLVLIGVPTLTVWALVDALEGPQPARARRRR